MRKIDKNLDTLKMQKIITVSETVQPNHTLYVFWVQTLI